MACAYSVRLARTRNECLTESIADDPRIVGDSIFGVQESCRTSVAAGGRTICSETPSPVAALDDVRWIEVKETDAQRTLIAVVLVPAALAGLLLLVVCSGDSGGGIGSPC
jgi:hypothetical protein